MGELLSPLRGFEWGTPEFRGLAPTATCCRDSVASKRSGHLDGLRDSATLTLGNDVLRTITGLVIRDPIAPIHALA